jgi:hypothetical protein
LLLSRLETNSCSSTRALAGFSQELQPESVREGDRRCSSNLWSTGARSESYRVHNTEDRKKAGCGRKCETNQGESRKYVSRLRAFFPSQPAPNDHNWHDDVHTESEDEDYGHARHYAKVNSCRSQPFRIARNTERSGEVR